MVFINFKNAPSKRFPGDSVSKFKVEVDRERCQGFGACVELCPGSFYFGEDGKSKIRGAKELVEGGTNLKDVIEVEDIGCFGQAEASCPFNAIKVEER